MLTLGLQGADLLTQLLAGAAALLLLFQPAAGAPRHLAQPAARQLYGGFGIAAAGVGVVESGLVRTGLEGLLLLAQLALSAGQLVALALQGLGIELVFACLAG